MDQAPNYRRQGIITAFSVVIIASILIAAVTTANGRKRPVAQASSTSPATAQTTSVPSADPVPTTTPQTATTNPPQSTSLYKDGSYTATGEYQAPGGLESINISVTLKDGTITDTSAVSGSVDRDSAEYQQLFISHYRRFVVGKNIDSVSLDRVSGSSLTPQGFNDAINQIKQQAHS